MNKMFDDETESEIYFLKGKILNLEVKVSQLESLTESLREQLDKLHKDDQKSAIIFKEYNESEN